MHALRSGCRRAGAAVHVAPVRPGLETRERILAAALEIFSERGFDGTTTRDIAARADVNLGLIKYYFGSKEKLWRAAVDRASGELAQRDSAPRSRARSRAAPRSPRSCGCACALPPAIPPSSDVMNDEGKRDGPRMRWLVDRHGKPLYEMLLAVLARGRRARSARRRAARSTSTTC